LQYGGGGGGRSPSQKAKERTELRHVVLWWHRPGAGLGTPPCALHRHGRHHKPRRHRRRHLAVRGAARRRRRPGASRLHKGDCVAVVVQVADVHEARVGRLQLGPAGADACAPGPHVHLPALARRRVGKLGEGVCALPAVAVAEAGTGCLPSDYISTPSASAATSGMRRNWYMLMASILRCESPWV
jgi:hypothetical protein